MYLQLTLEALENPSQRVAQGDSAGNEMDGTHHYDGGGGNPDGVENAVNIRSSSPETLLSKAELYTDQALAAGSGLPLVRLVKGQALALRGQHQVKAVVIHPHYCCSFKQFNPTSVLLQLRQSPPSSECPCMG